LSEGSSSGEGAAGDGREALEAREELLGVDLIHLRRELPRLVSAVVVGGGFGGEGVAGDEREELGAGALDLASRLRLGAVAPATGTLQEPTKS
jgi:hypothetical protein